MSCVPPTNSARQPLSHFLVVSNRTDAAIVTTNSVENISYLIFCSFFLQLCQRRGNQIRSSLWSARYPLVVGFRKFVKCNLVHLFVMQLHGGFCYIISSLMLLLWWFGGGGRREGRWGVPWFCWPLIHHRQALALHGIFHRCFYHILFRGVCGDIRSLLFYIYYENFRFSF